MVGTSHRGSTLDKRYRGLVDRIYAPNVTEYKIVTRNVRESPKQLTVIETTDWIQRYRIIYY